MTKKVFALDSLGRIIVTDKVLLKQISGAKQGKTSSTHADLSCGHDWACSDMPCTDSHCS